MCCHAALDVYVMLPTIGQCCTGYSGFDLEIHELKTYSSAGL